LNIKTLSRPVARYLPGLYLAVASPAFADPTSFLNYQDTPSQQQGQPPRATDIDKALKTTWPTQPAPVLSVPAVVAASDQRATPAPTSGAPKGDLLSALPVPDKGDQAVVPVVSQLVQQLPPRSMKDLPVCVSDAVDMEAQPPEGDAAYSCIPVSEQKVWTAEGHNSVRTTLQKWAQEAGWAVSWNAKKDWTPPNGFSHFGQFEAASYWMFDQLASNGVLYRVRWWEGNKVVVVTSAVSE
jgi:hypothetical protein